MTTRRNGDPVEDENAETVRPGLDGAPPDPDQPPPPRSTSPPHPAPAVALTVPRPPNAAPGTEPVEVVRIKPIWVLAVGSVAVAADLALRRPPWNNLATSILVGVAAVGLASAGRGLNRQQKSLLAGAAVFGLFLSLRTDPHLIVFNLTAATGLLALASLPGLHLGDLRPFRALNHGLEIIAQPFVLLSDLVDQCRARSSRPGTSRRSARVSAVARGLVIAGPLVVLLGVLLASADAVFASFFSTTLVSPGVVIGHGALLTIGGLAMATAVSFTHRTPSMDRPTVAPSLGRIEALTILGALDLLFLLFAAAQLVARSESGGAVLEAGGLSYKEYARQGFFQLLWVAGITLVVLLVVRAWTKEWSRGDRLFLGLSLIAVSLTLVIVAVAFGRLQLYVDDNGLTPLRFYSSAFSIWIGVAFLLVALRIVGWQQQANWMLGGLIGSGLAALLILNVLSPERVIAENLLHRGDAPILWHMHKLTGDGRAVLAEGIDQLPADIRDQVTEGLCEENARQRDRGRRSEPTGPLDWNLGTARSDRALDRLCGG